MTERFVFGRPLRGVDSRRNYMKEEKILEGFEITRLEEKTLEFRVEISVESLILGGENGDVVVGDGLFKGLEEEGFLDEFGELSIAGIEEGNENRVGVYLGGGGGVGCWGRQCSGRY